HICAETRASLDVRRGLASELQQPGRWRLSRFRRASTFRGSFRPSAQPRRALAQTATEHNTLTLAKCSREFADLQSGITILFETEHSVRHRTPQTHPTRTRQSFIRIISNHLDRLLLWRAGCRMIGTLLFP